MSLSVVVWNHKLHHFTNSARRVSDTGKVNTKTTKSQKTQKGARNGLQETKDRRDERSEEVVRRRLQLLAV